MVKAEVFANRKIPGQASIMTAMRFIRFSLILLVLAFLLFAHLSYAGTNDEAKMYFEKGFISLQLGQFEDALASLKKAIKLKSDFAEAQLSLGMAYDSLQNHEKAIAAYKEVIRIKPDDAFAYYGLGNSYMNLGNYKKAIESYKKAIKFKPDYAELYLNIGRAYIVLKAPKKTIIEYLKKAININPDLIEAHVILGATYGTLGQNEESINSYKEVIRLNPEHLVAHLGLGLAYGSLSQYKDAIKAFKEAIKIKPDFADAHYSLGNSYLSLSQYKKAIGSFKEAIKLKPKLAGAHYGLGYALNSLEQYEEAIVAFKETIRLDPEFADSYLMLGITYSNIGIYDQSIESYKEAIKFKPDYADAYHQLGITYYSFGKLDKAIKLQEVALGLYQKTSNRKGEADALYAIGNINNQQGKDIYALNNFQTALSIYRELEDLEGERDVLSDIGLVYLQLRGFSTGLEYFNKALEISEKLDDVDSVILILGNTALANFLIAESSSGNYEETIKYGKRAMEMAEKEGRLNNPNAITAYTAVGGAYWLSKDYNNALEYSKKILMLAQESKNNTMVAVASIIMGFSYDELGNYQEALNYHKEGDILSHDLDHPFYKWASSYGLGRVADKLGNIAEAKRQYFHAIDVLETSRERAQSLASKISIAIQAAGVYNDTTLFLIKSGEEEEAFNYMERARSRSFLDLLGSKLRLQYGKTTNNKVAKEERRLQFKINYLTEKIREATELTGKKDSSQVRVLLEKELNITRVKYSDLLEKIKKENPELSSLLNVDTLTLNEVQKLLDSDTTLLEYFITPEKTLLWIVDKSDFKVVDIGINSEELSLKVNAYREKIATLQPDYDKEAKELYDLLVRPAKPYIKTKRVGIVPHSVLHYLPFQALIDTDDGTNFLIEEYDIFYAPSASVLRFVYEKRKEISGKVLAFGNPELGDERLNLPYAEEEVKKIKEIYPETSLYLKEKATKERVKRLSGNYSIIHFASHGELNPVSPLFSSIRLAESEDEDGRLEVHEIFNLNLENTSLVTLSACKTGLGKLSKGDELIGLTRGFIYAGTPSIVASLWNVNDQSTSELMGLFYKNLKTHSKVESLRMAQIEMIRGDVGKGIVRGVGGITTSKVGGTKHVASITVDGSHPYFWAPFILLGDWK